MFHGIFSPWLFPFLVCIFCLKSSSLASPFNTCSLILPQYCPLVVSFIRFFPCVVLSFHSDNFLCWKIPSITVSFSTCFVFHYRYLYVPNPIKIQLCISNGVDYIVDPNLAKCKLVQLILHEQLFDTNPSLACMVSDIQTPHIEPKLAQCMISTIPCIHNYISPCRYNSKPTLAQCMVSDSCITHCVGTTLNQH